MGEECSLPQDVSTPELRMNREHDVSPHPFATWVRNALEVAYVRESLNRTAARRKRLYDTKVVNRKFPVGSWVLSYYPPPPRRTAQVGFSLDWTPAGPSSGYRSYGWHSEGTGTTHRVCSCG